MIFFPSFFFRFFILVIFRFLAPNSHTLSSFAPRNSPSLFLLQIKAPMKMLSTSSASLRGKTQPTRARSGPEVARSSPTAAASKVAVDRTTTLSTAPPPLPSPLVACRASTSSFAAVAAAAASSSPPGINGDVAITGATGTVGARLVRRLVARGVKVRVLTRDPAKSANKLAGIPKLTFFAKKDWARGIDGAMGGVVNLAGEPIATRWSPSLKAEIRRSRLDATRAVAEAIVNAKERPPVLVSSSAVGFYGTSETASFSESSPSGSDFLAKLCVEWEAEAAKAAAEGKTRVVTVRTGIVLAKEGGALAKMLPVFSLFAGGPLGSGVRGFFVWCCCLRCFGSSSSSPSLTNAHLFSSRPRPRSRSLFRNQNK